MAETLDVRWIASARVGGTASSDCSQNRAEARRYRCAGVRGNALDRLVRSPLAAARMGETPQECEQPIEDRERLRARVDPSPCLGDEERRLHFVRAAVRDRVVLVPVAFVGALAFGEVQADAAGSTADLIGELAILARDDRNDRREDSIS